VSEMVLAEFAHTRTLRDAAEMARQRGYKLIDAFTPFPVEGVADMLESRPSKVRIFMFAGGILVAAMALGGEYFTAVFNYPYNAGGRPLNSWPAFMLVPFATGILGASIAGFIRFLFETGLPRLHYPLFAVDGIERASQDRFFLAIEVPETEDDRRNAVDALQGAGALKVREVCS
jgi:Alternative complex III, ActD subunit